VIVWNRAAWLAGIPVPISYSGPAVSAQRHCRPFPFLDPARLRDDAVRSRACVRFMCVMISEVWLVWCHGGMTVRINELTPGDVVTMPGLDTGTLIAIVYPHPINQYGNAGLALVIWWLHTEKRWSFDALLPYQELTGAVVEPTDFFRQQSALRSAIIDAQQGRI